MFDFERLDVYKKLRLLTLESVHLSGLRSCIRRQVISFGELRSVLFKILLKGGSFLET